MARKAMIAKFLKTPKFKVRYKTRCLRCGRARAYIRKFKMCRLCFRSLASQGLIPGITKASW